MPTSAKSSAGQHQERIMVFIDGSNLYHVLGEVCGRHDLNFGKFAEKISGDRDLVRTYYYNIRQDSERDPNVATEQGKFLQTMYDTPYLEVRMGVSKRHGETMVEKGVDVFMATDLVAFAFMDLYDTAIVVSGDGDFFPAIQTAKNQGKHIEVAAFDNNLSSEAGNVADAVIKLNKTYFTGLWSDRRRRASTSPAPSTRRTRTTRGSSSRVAAATTEPDVASESTTEGSGRRPLRRRSATPRATSRSSGTRSTTRRRSPTRRTASSSTPDSAPVQETASESAPMPVSTPEPTIVPSNGNGSSGEESGSRTPVRRTPARRRVGARSMTSGTNGGDGENGTSTPPTPPALRRRTGSASDDDDSSSS